MGRTGVRRVSKGAATAALLAILGGAGGALAQQSAFPLGTTVGPAAQTRAPVLTLDQNRMFSGSDFGKRVQQAVEDAQSRLLAENRKIEAALAAEEKTLTEERKSTDPADFRKMADAFDKKVQKIRHDQDSKNRIIQAWREKERERFYEAALPILGQLVHDSGAVAILNAQAVFLSFKAIDVTDRAIERLNQTLGDGAKDAAKIDLDAPPPKADAVTPPSATTPREVPVPGAGEAIAPNGVLPHDNAPAQEGGN